MEEPNKGGENKLPEAPKEVPVKKPKETPPNPEAGKDKKEDDKVTEVLEANKKALSSAEAEIVRLKKELKRKGQDEESPENLSEVQETIESLKGEIDFLKSSLIPREKVDKVTEELQEAKKKNEELSQLLISKKTLGKGEGVSGNQDVIEPKPKVESFAKTPQEIAILERRGIDPVTGKKKK